MSRRRTKAAYAYVDREGSRQCAPVWWGKQIANAFIAGAKWQKKRRKKK